MIYDIISKIKKWFKQYLPDEKVQTGEQVTAIIKNKKGEIKCVLEN